MSRMSSTLVFRAKTTRVTSVIGGVVALLIASAVLVGSGGETAEIVPEAADHIFVKRL